MAQGAESLTVNPAIDIRMAFDLAGSANLHVSAYSSVRGFIEGVLTPGEAGYAETLAIHQERVLETYSLPVHVAGLLWRIGVLALPSERPASFAPEAFAVSPENYAERGFIEIPGCMAPSMLATLETFYRTRVAAGTMNRASRGPDRLVLHNDPAGRILQRALFPAVQALVGTPIKASYTFASLYLGGATLPIHTDRPQCAYTLSLLIDHKPTPADGLSPWALKVQSKDGQWHDCFQRLGGGLLFQGQELLHGRGPLPADQSCWTLLLHYVDAGFDGALD